MLTKQEIIKELQKFAKENGGKTPGEKVLFENTDIKIMDRRRYWPNYGELVLEARLTPNKFDKTKYSHAQLCNMFIKVIREKGKWPTKGILDVKHHNDPNFPDSATFYNKLGLISKLAKTILEYVGNKRRYKDIIDICNSIIEKFDKDAPQESLSIGNVGNVGYVYLLQSKLRNATAYKIGKTYDLENRIIQLNQPSNEQYIIWKIETDDPTGVESYWHHRFESKHLYPQKAKSEWFSLTKS